MSHKCCAIVVHCIDFRFQAAIDNWLQERGLTGDCDRAGHAGSCKDIVEDITSSVSRDIDVAINLHSVDKIILLHHTDCGAYGGAQPDDQNFHANQLRLAAEKLASKYPSITIEKWLAVLAADGQITFQAIA